MTNRRHAIAFLLCCLPLTACANAVFSVAALATGVYLVFGNAIVGLLEGAVLIGLFRATWWKALLVMLAANYVSSIGGLAILPMVASKPDLYTLWPSLRVAVILAFLVTLLLEWPFIAYCLKGKSRWLVKSILACLVLQTLSYTAIYCWCAKFSWYSLYTETETVSPHEIALPKGLRLYYIAAEDGDVYSRDLAGNQDTAVFDLNSAQALDSLFLQAPAKGAQEWELVAWHQPEDTDRFRETTIVHDVAQDVPRPVEEKGEEHVFRDGLAPKLQEAQDSQWEFRSGYDASFRLRGNKEGMPGEYIELSCDMPRAYWHIKNATHLPGDIVIFQLGDDQICLLDANRGKLALLARGRGPVVVVPKKE